MGNDFGKFALGGIGAVVLWRSLSSEAKDGIWRLVSEAIDAAKRQQLEQQRRTGSISLPFQALPPPPPAAEGIPSPVPPQLLPPPESVPELKIEADARWRELIPHPSIVVILGKRGSGKSALGYRLLELFKLHRAPYAVGVPENAAKRLPEWIGIADTLESVPQGACALIDEAYMQYHARDSQAKSSKEMSRLLNLSRQRDQTLIFITQESRQVDKNIVSVANVVVFKEPASLQVEFERPEVRKIAGNALQEFKSITNDRRRWSYVFAPEADFAGMVENELATYWSSGLSKAFAGGSGRLSRPRTGERMPLEEKRLLAHQLRGQGWSLSRIANHIGVSKATAVNYLKYAA